MTSTIPLDTPFSSLQVIDPLTPFKRVALVHDYWVTLRGGEQVFLALMRLFPHADCYALIRRRHVLPAGNQEPAIRTSLLQWVPFGARYHRALLPLYPMAARSLDLRDYDLVISSSSGFCHSVQTAGTHICYCHAPLRYAWNEFEATLSTRRSPAARAALGSILTSVRRADWAAAQRVTTYLANSAAVQARIAAYYGRSSTIVHPFVDTARYQPRDSFDSYLLVVSQLLPYKRVDLAVEACTRLGLRLVVVGDGPARAQLERAAGPTVSFLGRVGEQQLAELYSGCAAMLQCGEEDFGIAALEAQASGRPVIAYGVGGALETVVDGQTGRHFFTASVEALADTLHYFEPRDFDPLAIRRHAEHFDEAHFRTAILRAVERQVAERQEVGIWA